MQNQPEAPQKYLLTLSGTSGGRDNVGTSATSSTPVLSRGTVDGLLGSSGSVDSGHKTFNDGEVIIDDLGERSKAVGGAGSVGDDFILGLVGIQVDTNNEHRSISRGSRDDDLLGSTSNMGLCLVDGGEDTGGFDYVVSTVLTPRDLGGVLLSVDVDGLAVDNELAILGLNGALEATVGGVILEHVDHVFKRNERVVDGDNLDIGVLQSNAKNDTANTTKSVDIARALLVLNRSRIALFISTINAVALTYPLIPTPIAIFVVYFRRLFKSENEAARREVASTVNLYYFFFFLRRPWIKLTWS